MKRKEKRKEYRNSESLFEFFSLNIEFFNNKRERVMKMVVDSIDMSR